MGTRLIIIYLASVFSAHAVAQQSADVEYNPPAWQSTYAHGTGPRVVIDEAHHNFHTVDGRYRPCAELLRRDGYRVDGFDSEFSAETLHDVDVLMIVNALNERNVVDWSLPTPSAFDDNEIAAVRNWVECGGSLLLIADHMPFPGAADKLARAFGVHFSNGYARPPVREHGSPDTFEFGKGLWPSVLTCGRCDSGRVSRVATFGGSAFIPPIQATPVILLGAGWQSHETERAPGITENAPIVSVHGWCQGAIFQYGRGRVAVFGEAAMFTAQHAGPTRRPMGMNAPGAEQNYELLLNVLHWLSFRM